MSNFLDILDRYKFGFIAAFAVFVGFFIYLEMKSYVTYTPLEPFMQASVDVVEEEELLITPEDLQIIPDYQSGDVKSISRDRSDSRERSSENWSQNRSGADVEQSVKDFEKGLFENASGVGERAKIKKEMEERQSQRSTSTTKTNTKTTTSGGGDKAYSGNVMVDWSLAGRSPHQNNNWWVRNPGYTCGYGSAGRVTIGIKVNQNGDVISAETLSSSGANGCMLEQALKYAKLSRFNYAGTAKTQEGTITYTFVSQ